MKRTLVTRSLIRIGYITFIILICINLIQAQSPGETARLFPLPDNLKPNVDFWIKIYTLYSSDQIVIHDAEDLRIIYEVVDVNELFGHSRISNKMVWREIEKIKNKYRHILNKLAGFDVITPDKLERKERQVYYLFKSKASPEVFKQAAKNIRGQQGLRDEFRRGLIRSGRYMEYIEGVLKKYNLPRELTALPHVESSFDHRAYSKFGAAGIWQFTRGTGRRFMKINYSVDERFDPIKSTEAAARLLKQNYEELGTWPLAITAYNHGTNGLKRAIRKLGTRDIGIIVAKYRSRNFKFASRNFYAEFLAALKVCKNYKIYFGELQFDRPDKFLIFKVPNYVKISTLVQRLGVTLEDIKRLNPSLRRSVLSSKRHLPRGFELRLPWKKDFNPAVAYAQIPVTERYQQQVATDWYQVERGDNLQSIARRFKTTVADLMELNDIRNPHQIYVGQVIRLNPEQVQLTEAKAGEQRKKPAAASQPAKKLTKMGMGDQINAIPVPPAASSQLAKKESRQEKQPASRQLALAPQAKQPAEQKSRLNRPIFGTIYVQPEETLGHYADWLGIPTRVLRNLNGLKYGQDIRLGQKIKLVFNSVSEKEFRRKRMEYHRGIEEDFFASFTVEGVLVHSIKSGENIWYLCNQVYEIPYWLVRKYNPNKNLEQLKAGDELIIPIVGRIRNHRSIG